MIFHDGGTRTEIDPTELVQKRRTSIRTDEDDDIERAMNEIVAFVREMAVLTYRLQPNETEDFFARSKRVRSIELARKKTKKRTKRKKRRRPNRSSPYRYARPRIETVTTVRDCVIPPAESYESNEAFANAMYHHNKLKFRDGTTRGRDVSESTPTTTFVSKTASSAAATRSLCKRDRSSRRQSERSDRSVDAFRGQNLWHCVYDSQ